MHLEIFDIMKIGRLIYIKKNSDKKKKSKTYGTGLGYF